MTIAPGTTAGAWLKQRRKAVGLTQESLANCVGCSVVTIEKIEKGERHPSAQIAELLAGCLNIPDSARESFVKVARGELDLQSAPDLTRKEPPQSTKDSLPTPATNMLGRDADVAAIRALFQKPDVRMVTLTGPGGVGKTRLSLGVAHAMSGQFRDGIISIPLDAITDPALVVSTIAQSLDVKDTGHTPILDNLKRTLKDRHSLLLLDNLEQVVAVAPVLAELLAWSPQLSMLVTSREAAHIRGERQYQVLPLSAPDPAHHLSLADLTTYPSVALFLERAQDVQGDFLLTPDNAATIASICARLDGLPLAIELAAARLRLLSPHDIDVRLNKRFSLLTSGARDLPARHRTLYNAVAWSFDLLEPGEQRLFTRLGVFVGGCTLEAIESVCNAHDDLSIDTMSGISSLLDKSLLRSEKAGAQASQGSPRISMLETLREYALERLALSGEMESMQCLHAEYYEALVEAAEPELVGAHQSVWIERLEMERENIRAALDWSAQPSSTGIDGARAGLGLSMAGALAILWQVRGRISEGRERLTNALRIASPEHTATRARALFGAGWLALFGGDYRAAREYCTGSLEIQRELNNLWGASMSLNALGRAAEISRDFAAAAHYYGESLEIRTALGNRWGIAGTLNNMGRAALRKGEYDPAGAFLDRSLEIFRDLGDTGSTAILLNNLALVALRKGDLSRSADLFRECLDLELAVDYKWGLPYCFTGIAELALAQGDTTRSVVLLAAAKSTLQASGVHLDPIDHDDFKHNLALARENLQQSDFDVAWERGSTMAFDEAISYLRS